MRSVFGDYTLGTQRYKLYGVGKQVPVRPKVGEGLAYLLAHRDRPACAHPGDCLPNTRAPRHLWDAAPQSEDASRTDAAQL